MNVIAVDTHFEKNGRRFVPIGHSEEAPILKTNQDSYVKRCAEHGENVLRLLLEPVPFECFTEETVPGNFEKMDRYLDPIAEAADKYGMFLDIGAYFPNVNKDLWKQNPYVLMGVASSYEDLFGPVCTMHLKNRLTHIAESYNTVLFGLEFCCEMFSRNDVWVENMLSHCRDIGVMGSVSVIQGVGAKGWAQWTSPNLNYVSVHSYGGANGLFIPWLGWTVQGAKILDVRLSNVEKVVAECKLKGAFGKPFMDTETPYIPLDWWSRLWARWSLVSVSQEAMEKNFFDVAKRYLELGAAGPGWQWSSAHAGARVDGKPNAFSPAMYEYQQQIAGLVDR